MNYLQKRFSVHLGQSDSFRDNYDSVFGKKSPLVEPLPDPLQREESEQEMVELHLSLRITRRDALELLEDLKDFDSFDSAMGGDAKRQLKHALLAALQGYFSK